MIKKPSPNGTWLDRYLELVPDESLIEGFKRQTSESLSLFSSISEEDSKFKYAEGKWTLKELLLHLIDTERLFGFRALAFARNESQPLPGFDEDAYVANSFANSRSWQSLIEEFIVARTNSVSLFAGFAPEVLEREGIANNNKMSVVGLGFATLGHEIHHIHVIKTKYVAALLLKAN